MPSTFGVANPRGDTAAQRSFAQIPSVHLERSVFNRSCGVKTAFNSGYLVPIFVDEALPGDTFHLRATSFVRMTTPIFPLLDNLYLDLFFFAIPYRLVWDNWQKFNGEQDKPGDAAGQGAFTIPQFTNVTVAENSLSDYMGLPLSVGGNTYTFNSLHHRAYNLVYNTWFRSEDLTDSVKVDKGNGPDNLADYVLLRRTKRHDYFTSALPFVQKGLAVTLPLGSSAPVVGTGAQVQVGKVGSASTNYGSWLFAAASGSVGVGAPFGGVLAGGDTLTWKTTALSADLSSATAATINDLRQAFQIQKLLERDARGGTRYTEIIRSHFGVVSPDQRLQRPEYLGGGSTRINMHPVAATNFSTAATPAAVLGAFGTAGASGQGFFKSFVEHCLVLGLVNVRADINYQQGLHRMFSRRNRYDFYWPSFAHLGEQAVLNQEIYAQGSANPTADAGVWGYQERYAEYRYKPSIVTGTMRSTAAAPLDRWHLALNFTAAPALNNTFIGDQPPMARVLAVTTQPEFFGDFWFEFKSARPMPTYSVPGLIDHF